MTMRTKEKKNIKRNQRENESQRYREIRKVEERKLKDIGIGVREKQ